MSIFSNNGVSINYRSVGKGKNVVLIHGLGANHAFWHLNVTLPLVRKYRVTVYDLRGHGYSGMPACGYTSADMAEDLRALLNHLNIARAHLIGHSFGGAIALNLAVLYPERISSLSIVDSRVRTLQPTNRARDWPNWKIAKKRLAELGFIIPEDETESGLWLLEQLAQRERQKAGKKLEANPLYIPFSKWGGGNRSAERFIELLATTTVRQDLISTPGLAPDRLSNIQHPTLLIYGENSPAMLSFRGLQEHLHYCKSAIVPGAGHFFPLTQPKFFVNTVSRFFEELPQGDLRKYRRFSLRFSVDLRDNAATCFQAVTVDVSKEGLLVEVSRKLEIDSEVEVTTALDQDAHRLSIRGKVVRSAVGDMVDDYRYGIELFSEAEGYLAWQNFLVPKYLKLCLPAQSVNVSSQYLTRS